jgi:RHS repeat-associated protein
MNRWKKTILVSYLIIFLLAAGAAIAAGSVDREETDAICTEDLLLGGSGAFVGKPVSLFTGAETYSRTDLTIGSVYPIRIERQYNSKSMYDSQLGYGWALNHDRRIYTYPDESVTLRKECGRKRRFTPEGDGYRTPPSASGKLVKNTDESFTYTEKDGSRENYDPQGRLSSLIDTRGNSLVFTYEPAGKFGLMGLLLTNISTSPLTVSYDYRLSKIEEKDNTGTLTGKWVSFQYDDFSTGRLIGISDSANRTISYGHDGFGNLTTVTGAGVNAIYTYDDPGNIHRMSTIDEGQGLYTNYYDSKGQIYRQTHGTGVIDIEYLEDMKKTRATTTVKDSSGTVLNTQVRTVEFDDNGQIVKETDTFGTVKIYARNNLRIQREEYWENTGTPETPNLVLKAATDYTYDSYGNVKTKTEASDGDPNSTDWDAIMRTTSYTYYYEVNPLAPETTFHKLYQETVKSVVNSGSDRVLTYTHDDASGNLETILETGLLGNGSPYSYATTYNYHPDGKLQSINGPRTDVDDITTYYYAPTTGYLNGIERPLVGITTYADHDLLGNPQTITDPNNNSTVYTYDDLSRVRTTRAPGDTADTQYVYMTSGCSSCGGGNNIDYIILPEGNRIDYDYDSMGKLSKISDNAGNSINYAYDSEGNKLREEIRDTGGILRKSLDYQYDALNRLAQVRNPDNTYTEYGYDYAGNRETVVAPNGSASGNPSAYTTTYLYDALSRVTDVIQPGNVTTKYGYNSNSNLTSVRDANTNTTTYKYDDKGRVYQVISPDTGTTTYTYDPAGNMTSKVDASPVTITYQYDALNRLTTIDFQTDVDIVYSYDTCVNGKGRLCSMTDASGSTSYEYYAKGQMKTETKVIDGVTYTTQYTYDMNGNIKTMTYPSGRVVTYIYTNDRVVSVLNNAAYLATSIGYKAFGGMTSITYGNGIAGSIDYDNQYRITSIAAGTVLSLNYSLYDANGNIKTIQNGLESTKSRSFTYDGLDRLDTAISSGIWGGTLDWDYDGVGNRVKEIGGSLTTNYNYFTGTNKLQSLTGALGKTFTFDSNGNTDTEDGGRDFVYDQNQRLIRVNDGSATKGEYTYNGNGQRVKKVASGATTIFHYSQSGQIIAESEISGNISAEYVYLNGQPLAKIEGGNSYYYHNDHLATPQKMTDASGVVVWSADYKPFGEATVTVSTITNNLRFPGQYFDTETGNHYNYFRDYNPVIGRYIEADPLGIEEGVNHLYLYVQNNPAKFMDPYGNAISVFTRSLDWKKKSGSYLHCVLIVEDKCNGTKQTWDFQNVDQVYTPALAPGNPIKNSKTTVVYGKNDKDELVGFLANEMAHAHYDITSYNCCHWVEEVLNKAGISIWKNPNPWPFN